MITRMLGLGSKHHQVTRIVISLISIYVMHNLAGKQRSSENLLCHNTMRVSPKYLGVCFSFA